MKTKWYWKALIILVILGTIILISTNKVAESIVEYQLDKIKEQFAGSFEFSYDELDLQVFRRKVILKKFRFSTIIDSTNTKDKIDFELDELDVHFKDYFKLVAEGQLDIKKIEFVNPHVIYGINKNKKQVLENSSIGQSDSAATTNPEDLFLKELTIGELILEKGKADVYHINNQDEKLVFIDSLFVNITGIFIDFTSGSLFGKPVFENFKLDAYNMYKSDLKDHNLRIDNLHYDYST